MRTLDSLGVLIELAIRTPLFGLRLYVKTIVLSTPGTVAKL